MSDWIQTYTGKKAFPLEPEKTEFDIRDIAHALSLKCRFNGHCTQFYSVAEHSIRVASIVRPESKLWALLHDATEAYLPDVCRPIKGDLWIGESNPRCWETPDQKDPQYSYCHRKYFRTFADAEAELMIRIADAFHLPHPDSALIPEDVKQADTILLATEARDLMGEPPESWNLCVPVLPANIDPMSPDEAERLFLKCFEEFSVKKDQP